LICAAGQPKRSVSFWLSLHSIVHIAQLRSRAFGIRRGHLQPPRATDIAAQRMSAFR
jgi:hypothetical protein